MSVISAGNTTTTTLTQTGDTTGNLVFTTGGANAVALTLDNAQTATFQNPIKGGALITGTAQNSTSGTSIVFNSIPSWAKEIIVMFNGVSTNGSSVIQVQLGAAGGIETTGYATMAGLVTTTSNTTRGATYTSGFPTAHGGGTGDAWRGSFRFNLFGSNLWVGTGIVYNSADSITMVSGTKTLSGTLTQISITTVNGTDAFDAGSINIMYG